MMLELKSKNVIESYNRMKNGSLKAYENGDIEEALSYVESAASIAYHTNIIIKDDDLDLVLANVGRQNKLKDTYRSKDQSGIVFYDAFCSDNKGLTQQYIRALMSWNVEFVYVYESKSDINNNIIKELKAYGNADIQRIDTNESRIDQIKKINTIFYAKLPNKIFFHIAPWSVSAVACLSNYNEATRYQINLTDHAFWLGVNCVDYSLEFRDFGCSISRDFRQISESKILLQKYYPVFTTEEFQGFPEGIDLNKVIVFTGGAYYKMFGDNYQFFELIKKLINQNPNIQVWIAGNGDGTPIREFIRKNKFDGKVILTGNRSDIVEVFKNIDIYLGTYPFGGGLMMQLAAVAKKPIISFQKPNCGMGNLRELFIDLPEKYKLTYSSVDSFLNNAKRLIESENERVEFGNSLSKYIVSVDDFSSNLKNIISNSVSIANPQYYKIDLKKRNELYLELANSSLNSYIPGLFKKYRFKSIILFKKETLILFKLILKLSYFNKILSK